MKLTKLALIAATVAAPAFAGAGAPGDKPEDKYFSQVRQDLTPQERQALNIAQRWQSGSAVGMRALAGPAGAVQYVYGVQEPSVVCAVLQVCDVALQPGEVVNPNGVQLGDTSRWSAEPAISGSGDNQVEHIIIKPFDVGLVTSLVVATDRRSYHIKLVSSRNEYMPLVNFSYPEEQQAKWRAVRAKAEKKREEQTITQTAEYLGDLDFNYTLEGEARWKPVRVYNNKEKTIIEMGAEMSQTEAPVLLVLRESGSDDDTVMVNYRIQKGRYIVDAVFDRAILVAGVGDTQDRVTITRGSK